MDSVQKTMSKMFLSHLHIISEHTNELHLSEKLEVAPPLRVRTVSATFMTFKKKKCFSRKRFSRSKRFPEANIF